MSYLSYRSDYACTVVYYYAYVDAGVYSCDCSSSAVWPACASAVLAYADEYDAGYSVGVCYTSVYSGSATGYGKAAAG